MSKLSHRVSICWPSSTRFWCQLLSKNGVLAGITSYLIYVRPQTNPKQNVKTFWTFWSYYLKKFSILAKTLYFNLRLQNWKILWIPSLVQYSSFATSSFKKPSPIQKISNRHSSDNAWKLSKPFWAGFHSVTCFKQIWSKLYWEIWLLHQAQELKQLNFLQKSHKWISKMRRRHIKRSTRKKYACFIVYSLSK